MSKTMNAETAALRIRTSDVLAGAYLQHTIQSNLTHSVEYDERGWMVRVLCKRVSAGQHLSSAHGRGQRRRAYMCGVRTCTAPSEPLAVLAHSRRICRFRRLPGHIGVRLYRCRICPQEGRLCDLPHTARALAHGQGHEAMPERLAYQHPLMDVLARCVLPLTHADLCGAGASPRTCAAPAHVHAPAQASPYVR